MSLCVVCHRSAKFECSGCLGTFYCSKDHQLEHWMVHSSICGVRQAKSYSTGLTIPSDTEIEPIDTGSSLIVTEVASCGMCSRPHKGSSMKGKKSSALMTTRSSGKKKGSDGKYEE